MSDDAFLAGVQGLVGGFQRASQAKLDRDQREKMLDAELRLKGLIKTKDPLTGEDAYAEDPAFREQKNYEQDVDFYKAGLIPTRDEGGRITGAGVNKEYFEAKSNADPMTGLVKSLTVDRMKTEKEEKARGTEGERKAATYAKRTKEANDVFEGLTESGYNRADIKEGVKSAYSKINPTAKGENLGKQEQAERNFVNSILRRESGAVISPSEFESAEKQYFPRVGDTPEVLAQKKQNRMTAIEGLKQEAGRAYDYQEKSGLIKEKVSGNKPKRIMQNGVEYILNEQTGQYE